MGGLNNIIIAGGAGFIGSHLVRNLLGRNGNLHLTVIDNLSTGSIKNLNDHLDDARLEFIEADITKPLTDIPDIDIILNLAAIANPLDYEQHRLDTLMVNSRGNENLIKMARRWGAKYVFFSTSEVYGDHNPLPANGLREEDNCRQVLHTKRSPYAIGKMFGEEIVSNLCTEAGLDYLIIRPFNVYGPNMDVRSPYGRVIPNFLNWAILKRPLKVNGDGTQQRSFIWIEDFIEALLRLIEQPNLDAPVVNIGNPISVSILELALLVNKITRNPAGIEFADRYPFEPHFRTPNIDRITQLTGWFPKVSLAKGLEHILRTQDWMRKGTTMQEVIA
jgi:nucleoside-diphosphate-sugar epimerase